MDYEVSQSMLLNEVNLLVISNRRIWLVYIKQGINTWAVR